jgi:hypothetical protein
MTEITRARKPKALSALWIVSLSKVPLNVYRVVVCRGLLDCWGSCAATNSAEPRTAAADWGSRCPRTCNRVTETTSRRRELWLRRTWAGRIADDLIGSPIHLLRRAAARGRVFVTPQSSTVEQTEGWGFAVFICNVSAKVRLFYRAAMASWSAGAFCSKLRWTIHIPLPS